jgi:multiple sugar transport system substrate-binding protein
MYYNAELFDKAQIPYPTQDWTWGDMLSAAKELTHRDSNGRAVQLGVSRGDWASFLWQAGGDILNKAQSKSVLDAAPAVRAFQFLQDLVVKYKVAPTNEDVGTTSSSSATPIIQNMFSAGRIGMYFAVRGQLPQVCAGNFAFNVAPMPKDKQHAAVLSVGPTVLWSGSKNKEAAFKLMAFFIGLDAQRLKMSNGFAFPLRKDALTQAWFNKYTCGKAKNYDVDNAFATELDNGWARSYPVHPQFQQIQTVITAQLDALYIGQQSASQICKTMAESVNGILGGAN